MSARTLFVGVVLLMAAVQPVRNQGAANWSQFRGPNASGLAERERVPVEFGPTKAMAWKRALPPGHSSPAIWGSRIFLTGVDSERRTLEVLCLSTQSGEILWRHQVAAPQLETVHAVSNAATATPVVDEQIVYTYFASYGVVALDHAGKERWSVPLPMLKTTQGSGTSPVLHGNLVVLNRDAVEGGALVALDRHTGKSVWKTDYPVPQGRRAESNSTPVVWRGQAVLHRVGFVEGYDLADGRRVWWVSVPTTGTSTVVSTPDTIIAAAWTPFGEADQTPPFPEFAALVRDNDKDGNGLISEAELPSTLLIFTRPDMPNVPDISMPLNRSLPYIDQNKDGQVNEAEWQQVLAFRAKRQEHGVIAVKPEGEGDLTSKVVWTEKLAVPEVPSPLLVGTRLYLVRNGGILSCLDSASGKVVYRARVGAPGPYFASPVAAYGKIYLASGEGMVTVFAAGDELKVDARNDLGEPIYATPAIAAGTLYVRTTGHLYAFR